MEHPCQGAARNEDLLFSDKRRTPVPPKHRDTNCLETLGVSIPQRNPLCRDDQCKIVVCREQRMQCNARSGERLTIAAPSGLQDEARAALFRETAPVPLKPPTLGWFSFRNSIALGATKGCHVRKSRGGWESKISRQPALRFTFGKLSRTNPADLAIRVTRPMLNLW